MFTFTWSAAGRLVGVGNVTTTVVYTYNGDGVRVAQAVGGTVTTYVQDLAGGLSQVLVESTGAMTTEYVYGHDLLAEGGTTWAWHLNDGLGSVRQLVDDSGDVTLAQGYTPFGVLLWREGDAASGYGFTGEQEDAYIKLVFLRARWYEPGAGRFLSQDPFPGLTQNPQSMNGWSYVHGNPVNLTDPSGQYPPLPEPPGHGPSLQPDYDVCKTTWPKSGPFRDLCDRAYLYGDLDAMEEIYKLIAAAEYAVMPQSAIALRHFLHGTTTPGETLYFSHWWYLWSSVTSVTRVARERLLNDIENEIDKLRDSCKCNIPPDNPIHNRLSEINIDPPLFGIPDDIQTVLGSHTLNVDAYLDLNAHCIGWVKLEFYVYEWFDFRKGAGNFFEIPFLGWQVPTAWADFLVDAGRAAEYWTVIQWTELALYWKWK